MIHTGIRPANQHPGRMVRVGAAVRAVEFEFYLGGEPTVSPSPLQGSSCGGMCVCTYIAGKVGHVGYGVGQVVELQRLGCQDVEGYRASPVPVWTGAGG